jgi:ABC-type multidrug transport system fused ATPase/permease subunit
MKRSSACWEVALGGLEVLSRLALAFSVIALLHGASGWSVVGSALAAGAGVVRNLVDAHGLRHAIDEAWSKLVDAATRQGTSSPPGRGEGGEGVLALAAGAAAAAQHRAEIIPQAAGLVVSILVLVGAFAAFFGARWLVLGAGIGGVVGGLTVLAQRRVQPAAEQAWASYRDAARDLTVLLLASGELRANNRESACREQIFRHVSSMAREQHRVAMWQAGIGGLPGAVAVLGAALPFRVGARMLGTLSTAQLADMGVLGMAALTASLTLMRLLARMSAEAPLRQSFRDFLEKAVVSPRAAPKARHARSPQNLRAATFRFHGFAHAHVGASHYSPERIDLDWASPGLVVSGANGSGKSTLALAVLGLITPTHGDVLVDDIPVTDFDLTAFRERVAYVPQSSFVEPAMDVRWHVETFAGVFKDSAIEAALERVGLLTALVQHGSKCGVRALEVPVSELSGGERQRLLLARTLLRQADLWILDEPEAGLDATGRRLLRELVDWFVGTGGRVLLIAHDPSVVPPAFQTLVCKRAPVE